MLLAFGAITVPNGVPAALTSRTITDPGALAAELAAVRDRGYAVARGELEDGLDGLAVPVRDRPEMRTVCTAALCVSGPAYRMEIDLVGTSVAFRPGHRIRVHVTSSHFPQFDRNPNTGAAFGKSDAVKVAEQTIYHDTERPSHILLPVIPRRAR